MTHPYGWLSLLPPLVAIVLAIATRRAVASLVAGIVCGAFITAGGHPGIALYDVLEVHLWPALIDPNKLRVFAFTLMMGAMIGIVCRSGGMQGLMRLVSPLASSRRSGQLTVWLSGLIIFFDDYANTVLLGGTLRPLCDRWRISREKLAYLVDSTAAPVAGLSLLSTWVAVEIDYLHEGLLSLPSATDLGAIDLFVGSIPYRFYVLSALLFIPILALTGRDYGPMWRAERRRLRSSSNDDPQDGAGSSSDLASANLPARWYNAVLPIVTTVLVVLGLFYATGRQELGTVALDPANGLKEIFGAADSYLSLYYGALAGLLLAALLSRAQGLLSAAQIAAAAAEGARVMVPALIILWCATALSRMTGDSRIDGTPPTVPYEYKAYRPLHGRLPGADHCHEKGRHGFQWRGCCWGSGGHGQVAPDGRVPAGRPVIVRHRDQLWHDGHLAADGDSTDPCAAQRRKRGLRYASSDLVGIGGKRFGGRDIRRSLLTDIRHHDSLFPIVWLRSYGACGHAYAVRTHGRCAGRFLGDVTTGLGRLGLGAVAVPTGWHRGRDYVRRPTGGVRCRSRLRYPFPDLIGYAFCVQAFANFPFNGVDVERR